MTVQCTMYCPKCRKGYVVENLDLQLHFVMEECDECNVDGEFIFKENIF